MKNRIVRNGMLLVAIAVSVATAPLKAQAGAAVAPWQIAAGGKMEFEVASVKLAQPGVFRSPNFPLDTGDAFASMVDGMLGEPAGNRFSASMPLATYITFAYKLSLTRDQTESLLARLPKWVSTDRFDIQARAAGSPTKDQMRLMMQALLADRFKLAVHFETHRVPVLALTLIKPGKLGPKLRAHADGPACDATGGKDVFPPLCNVYMMSGSSAGEKAGSRNTTMDLLASSLPGLSNASNGDGRLDRPVVDQTGLSGSFDFTMEWTRQTDATRPPNADVPPDSPGPTFLEALHEQLGLKLESTVGSIETLVIDHVESPSAN
jgi:bla regulator protein blaR1